MTAELAALVWLLLEHGFRGGPDPVTVLRVLPLVCVACFAGLQRAMTWRLLHPRA